jgi:hypothetical protein
MGVKYVKVEGRRDECPCSITTEKGILWEYTGDKYRHFQTLCGPCAEDLFGDINMFKLPVLTPEQVTEIRPENREEECGESEPATNTSQTSPDITDLLANLARRVSSLEQQLSATQGNVEKLAEELANVTHWNKKHATMFGKLYEDVRLLKDCAHPKEVEVVTFEKFLDSVADDVAKKLAEKVTNDLRTEMRLKALRGF